MLDIRRILIIFVIGVLYAVLVYSTIEAVYPSPEYNDFCREKAPRPYPVEKGQCSDPGFSQAKLNECMEDKGSVVYNYDANDCPVSWKCSDCDRKYRESREQHGFWNFLIASILGLIGIVVSLYLPMKKGTVHEWVGSGLMLGGMLAIFFGTLRYFGDLHRIARPIIILLELALVIYLSYKKLGKK